MQSLKISLRTGDRLLGLRKRTACNCYSGEVDYTGHLDGQVMNVTKLVSFVIYCGSPCIEHISWM